MTLFYHRFTGALVAGDQFSYGWYSSSLRTLAAAQTAAVAWNATLWNGASAGNGYKDHCIPGTTMLNVTTIQVDITNNKQLARADTAQVIAGVAAGNPMPGDVALCVSTRSAIPRRDGRGRFYLPQPAASEMTAGGRVLADFVADVKASLLAAWTAYNSASDRPVLWGRTSHVQTSIVSYDIADLYATQRRRENKVIPARSSQAMP